MGITRGTPKDDTSITPPGIQRGIPLFKGSTKEITAALFRHKMQAFNVELTNPGFEKCLKLDFATAQLREKLLSFPMLNQTSHAIEASISKLKEIATPEALQSAKLFEREHAELAEKVKLANATKDILREKYETLRVKQFASVEQIMRSLNAAHNPTDMAGSKHIVDELKEQRVRLITLRHEIEKASENQNTTKESLDALHKKVFLSIPTAARSGIIPPAGIEQTAPRIS